MGIKTQKEDVYWMCQGSQDICHMMANGEMTEKKLATPIPYPFLREL